MGETGARSESEVLHLQWEDVDLDQGFIRIRSGGERRRTKGGRGRWVPMSLRLRRAMQEHFASYRLASYDGAGGFSTTRALSVTPIRGTASGLCAGPLATRSSVLGSPPSYTSTTCGTCESHVGSQKGKTRCM